LITVYGILIIFGIGIFLILNGLRYFRYNKLISFTPDLYDTEMYGGLAAISMIIGSVFILFLLAVLFLEFKLIGVVLDIIFFLFFVFVFYWYWHTKKDPFSDL
jgi:ABC-type phosphate transport system permease subunit